MYRGRVQNVFVSARILVLSVSLISLCLVGYYRLEFYLRNVIIHESTMQDIDDSWFDMSICYGPKYSLETVSLYLKANMLRQEYPDTWRQILADIDPADLHVHGASAVGSIEQYRNFFVDKFNWSVDSMYDVGNAVNMESLGVGWFRHTFPHNATKFKADFHFLSLRYSWCYNYSYIDMFAGHEAVDGATKSKNVEDPYHKVGIYNHQYDWYFERNRVSEYIDVYVYPKGHEFEYPLIEDHVPFRIDMADWQRLRASARKIIRKKRPMFNCFDQESLGENQTYVYNLCLTWCLRRTVLNHVRCTFPELDHFIYNFTKVVTTYMATPPEKRALFRSSVYFNADTAWPWMKQYLYLQPCDSPPSFREAFDMFEKTFFPRGDKFAMNDTCRTDCPPDCIEYHGLLATEGTELHAATEKIHCVTIFFNARLEEIREKWKYTISQLLIDVSGVMSFLLGLSVIAIHEWCFILTRWLVQRCSHGEEMSLPEPAYLRDDMRYDDYHDYDDYDYDDYGYRDERRSSRQPYPRYSYNSYGSDHREYDSYDDYGGHYDDYGDESFDYAGDEKVLDAAHSGILYDHERTMSHLEPHTKASHLAP